MAVHTFDLRGIGLPFIDKGTPIFRAWRHNLDFGGTANAAVGDHIYIYGRVPQDEIWQIRRMEVSDATAAAGAQGWQRQEFMLNPVVYAAAASAAVPVPSGPMTEQIPQWRACWVRVWDGGTYLTWQDVNGTPLVIRDKDPVWTLSQLPPGSSWLLRSLFAETASGGVRGLHLEMVVDRIQEPLGYFDRMLKRHPLLLQKDLHLLAVRQGMRG